MRATGERQWKTTTLNDNVDWKIKIKKKTTEKKENDNKE